MKNKQNRQVAILFMFLICAFLPGRARAGNSIQLKLFKASGESIAVRNWPLPTKTGQVLELRAPGLSCETGALAAVSLTETNPLHLTLVVGDRMTSFQGDVVFSRATYISLDDETFCEIQIR